MKNSKREKKKGRVSAKKRRGFVIALVICAIVLICGAAWYMNLCRYHYEGDEDVRIYIPKGATSESVADTLRLRLGDEFGGRVYKIWKWRGGVPERASGSYVVSPGDVAMNISRNLLVHAETPVKVTFNNIRTMPQLAERVSKNMAFSADEFIATCDSVLPELGFKKPEFPAAFLPDTYEFYWTASPSHVIRSMVNVRSKYWNQERTAQATALGLSPEQIATIASIVEEETAKADERPKVARLYLNRLKKGMMLQADPTVKFAVGDFSLRRITNRHLAVESPYNTYKHQGLPPGPIRIVERKTLDAVLYAPMHNYIYMCAKEDFSGYHNFAMTDKEHMANARRYHAALNARNIK